MAIMDASTTLFPPDGRDFGFSFKNIELSSSFARLSHVTPMTLMPGAGLPYADAYQTQPRKRIALDRRCAGASSECALVFPPIDQGSCFRRLSGTVIDPVTALSDLLFTHATLKAPCC